MKKKITKDLFTPEQFRWLMEGSANSPENFSTHRYYTLCNNEIPSQTTYTGGSVEVMSLKSMFIHEMDANVVHTAFTVNDENVEVPTRFTIRFPNTNYLVQISSISKRDAANYGSLFQLALGNEKHVYTGQVIIFHPEKNSDKRNHEFEDEIFSTIENCELQAKPGKPFIYMIEVLNQKFALVAHPVHENFEIKNLDMNYGYGFEKFHNELLSRFNTQNKGLVLFHGIPGTGKTFYIRHLLRKMADGNKMVIYMPPNMVDHLTEPAFMTFLSKAIADYSERGKLCILLIEDAEPLLAARQTGVRIQGVTNLLNMTDGLLNDMLNLQIICTFNVELNQLDDALLRPGRLVARKEFRPMTEIDANILASSLGITHHFDGPVTISEVYAMLKNQNTLIHDIG